MFWEEFHEKSNLHTYIFNLGTYSYILQYKTVSVGNNSILLFHLIIQKKSDETFWEEYREEFNLRTYFFNLFIHFAVKNCEQYISNLLNLLL